MDVLLCFDVKSGFAGSALDTDAVLRRVRAEKKRLGEEDASERTTLAQLDLEHVGKCVENAFCL